MKKIKYVALGTVLLGLTLTGCSTNNTNNTNNTASNAVVESGEYNSITQYPLTVYAKGSDFVEVEQVYEVEPQSVVTANASSIEMLYNLGLADKIVGTIAIDNEPAEEWSELYNSLEILGDKMTISKEVIASSNADIIIGRSATFDQSTFGSIQELNELGINVYSQKASDMSVDVSMQSIIDDVLELGEIFNINEIAQNYADTLTQRLNSVMEKAENATKDEEPMKVMVISTYVDGTFSAFGANAKLQSGMLSALNCVNVLESGSGSLSLENLVEANPDVIIYISADRNQETDKVAIESILNNSILSSVPAIANNKIIEIPYDGFMDYGVRNFETLEILADYLYE